MNTDPRALETLRNRSTRYEVCATANGASVRLGFTGRRTKSALLDAAKAQSGTVLAMLGDADPEPVYDKARGWVFGPVRVHFSGRTERDAAVSEAV